MPILDVCHININATKVEINDVKNGSRHKVSILKKLETPLNVICQ